MVRSDQISGPKMTLFYASQVAFSMGGDRGKTHCSVVPRGAEGRPVVVLARFTPPCSQERLHSVLRNVNCLPPHWFFFLVLDGNFILQTCLLGHHLY